MQQLLCHLLRQPITTAQLHYHKDNGQTVHTTSMHDIMAQLSGGRCMYSVCATQGKTSLSGRLSGRGVSGTRQLQRLLPQWLVEPGTLLWWLQQTLSPTIWLTAPQTKSPPLTACAPSRNASQLTRLYMLLRKSACKQTGVGSSCLNTDAWGCRSLPVAGNALAATEEVAAAVTATDGSDGSATAHQGRSLHLAAQSLWPLS